MKNYIRKGIKNKRTYCGRFYSACSLVLTDTRIVLKQAILLNKFLDEGSKFMFALMGNLSTFIM